MNFYFRFYFIIFDNRIFFFCKCKESLFLDIKLIY